MITRALLRQRLRYWIPRLQLQAWEITGSIAPMEKDAAECDAAPEYLNAAVRIDPEKVPVEDLEATVVHELIHCHTWRLTNVAEVLARGDPALLEWVRTEQETLATNLERVFLALDRLGRK